MPNAACSAETLTDHRLRPAVLRRLSVIGWAAGLVLLVSTSSQAATEVYHTVKLAIPSSEQSRQAEIRAEQELAPLLGSKGLRLGQPVLLRIFKEEQELEIWIQQQERFTLLRTYMVCEASGRPGPKLAEGDRQSPEGFYQIGRAQLQPWSRYHLALDLGFPNQFDQDHGRTGSHLMIHGRCTSSGCFAMADFRIEQIYTLVAAALAEGQASVPVHIFPFRCSDTALNKQSDHRWLPFWQNLCEGYAFFEQQRQPPLVSVAAGRYLFSPPALP